MQRVLVRGESGSGKELVARAIHDSSGRAQGPFVAMNMAAAAPPLAVSEFFGHVRGAFSGATSDHRGHFAQASGGTLEFVGLCADDAHDLELEALGRGALEDRQAMCTQVLTDLAGRVLMGRRRRERFYERFTSDHMARATLGRITRSLCPGNNHQFFRESKSVCRRQRL